MESVHESKQEAAKKRETKDIEKSEEEKHPDKVQEGSTEPAQSKGGKKKKVHVMTETPTQPPTEEEIEVRVSNSRFYTILYN